MTVIETDSFPRVAVRDLFLVLQVFDRTQATEMENIRLRICVHRKLQRKGTFLWSAARDTSVELVRLGLIEGPCNVKNTQQYESMKRNRLVVTSAGRQLLEQFKADRAKAYDALFALLVIHHPYLRQFIGVLNRHDIVAPVISSMKEHVSPRYAANAILAEDVADGRFDHDELIERVGQRIGRRLEEDECKEITHAIENLIREAKPSALNDETTRFAKNFLNKLNDIVVPAVFRNSGMGFDFRTHRTVWTIGQEFKTWAIFRSHPEHDAWLIVRTSTLALDDERKSLATLSFDYGLKHIAAGFLAKLYAAYLELQSLSNNTFVPAWELRAVFCVQNRCQPTVFNSLLDQYYGGSDDFRLQLEIQRQKPQHEMAVRARNRNIGSIRVVKG